MTFKESGINVPYHLYTIFYSVASVQLIFLLMVFVEERQRNIIGRFTSLAYSINTYLVTITIVIFAFFVSEAILSLSTLSQSHKLIISIIISALVLIPLIILAVREGRLNQLILQVPPRITVNKTQDDEEEPPFDVVIYNNTKKNLENVNLVMESSKGIEVTINPSQENLGESSGGTVKVGVKFNIKPNGRRFYIPQIKVSEISENTDTLKVSIFIDNKAIVERQILMEIR